MVYRDFNGDAIRDSINTYPNYLEPGVKGVVAKVYNTAGALVGSDTTDAYGRYSIPVATYPIRLEFTNLGNYNFTTKSRSVQFYNGATTTAYFGVNYPGDYAQANPKVMTPVMRNGTSNNNIAAIRNWNYDNSGTITDVLNTNQVGTIYGLAYKRSTKQMFASAYVKRHTGLLDLNNDNMGDLANIYVINTLTNTSTLWKDLSSLGINFGTIPNDAGRGLSGYNQTSYDPLGFEYTGLRGIGDIELSDDENTLYLTNLFDKKLYAIDVSTQTLINSWTIPQTCSNNDVCNFGLKCYKGDVYIGQVCTGLTSQSASDLNAKVIKFNGTTFTTVLNFPINYTKGRAYTPTLCTGFFPWINTMPTCFSSAIVYPQAILSDIAIEPVTGNMILGFRDRTGDQSGFQNYNGFSPPNNILRDGMSGGDLLMASPNANGTFTLENNGTVGGVTSGGAGNNEGPGGGEYFYSETFGSHEEITQGALSVLAGKRTVISTIMDPFGINTGGTAHFQLKNGIDTLRKQIYSAGESGDFGKANGLGDIEILADPAPIQIGDRVWNDVDGDGIQDAGEGGISGVLVQLYEGATLVQSMTTGASGSYLFDDLKPNTAYFIRINSTTGAVATNFKLSPTNSDPTDNGDARDNDASLVNGFYEIAYTTGIRGQNDHTLDFGFEVTTCLGNYVWNDVDKDGRQDVNEVGVAGVTVSLILASTNAVVSSTKTDAYGKYKFCDLIGGTAYKVKFTLPANYEFTGANASGIHDSLDSDVLTTGLTGNYTVNAGASNMTVDAGIYEPTLPSTARVGDKVWLDTDGDGVQDPTEKGVSGVTVWLLNCASNSPIQATVTNADGEYFFDNITPTAFNNYKIAFDLPLGMVFTTQTGALSVTTNSDVNPTTGQTACFGAVAGSNVTYIDAGIVPQPVGTASIGNRVWYDKDQDGIQDSDEAGLQQVLVRLYNAAGNTILKDTRTDASGNYLFNGLTPGCYKISVSLPWIGGVSQVSPKDAGIDTTMDSDMNPGGTLFSDVVCVAANEHNMTVDAGFYNTSSTNSIGDYVWLDVNKNGLQDANEQGYAGVPVSLYNCSTGTQVAVTTTDIYGKYRFNAIANGNYYVSFGFVDGYEFTMPYADQQGMTGGLNSDVSPGTGRTNCVSLTGNTHVTYLDAGIYPADSRSLTSSLGGTVWIDINQNGLLNTGEPGVSGVKVVLVNATTNTSIDSTTTDPLGDYLFTNLLGGDYKVVFSNTPSGYTYTTAVGNVDDDNNSDPNPATGMTELIALPLGDDKFTLDAGLIPPVGTICLGDYVWYDFDHDGIQDSNEPGAPGVTVKLYAGGTKTVLGNTTTDVDGKYMFCGLINGTDYSVGFENLPSGYGFTLPTGVLSTTDNSDADLTTGRTSVVTLGSVYDLTLDAGLYSSIKGSLGNRAWLDSNSNGLQDPNEPGIPGILVTLYNSSNVAVSSTVTDENGIYMFTNVDTGTYTIGFSGYPNTLVPTTKGTNMSSDDDSNIDSLTAMTSSVVVIGSSSDMTLDAGFKPNLPAGLGNYAWIDENKNGFQDAAEKGIGGVIATLYGPDGTTVIGHAITNASGFYTIQNLNAGDYIVGFSNAPTSLIPTSIVGQLNDVNNSDLTSNGKTSLVSLASGTYNPNVDAGYKKAEICLGDYVWNDVNQDGIQNNAEVGVAGINVNLYDATTNQLVQTSMTDAYGKYQFCGLQAGTYKVKFTLPVNYDFTSSNVGNDVADSDPNPSDGFTDVITLFASEVNMTVDAGIYQPLPIDSARIGDKVWLDINGNGTQDPSESGLSGITVSLYNCNNPSIPVKTTITDAMGNYLFEKVATGSYQVGINIPLSMVATLQNGAVSDVSNSDINPTTGRTACFAVTTGDTITYVDAGLTPKAVGTSSIGDKVWNDADHDGVQDPNESGVPGVTVTLYGPDGTTVITTTSTDGLGNYSFNGINSGCYVVGFSNLPSGYVYSPMNAGTDTSKNSDANVATGKTNVFCISSGQSNDDIDAGIYNPSGTNNLSGKTWYDADKSGIRVPGEYGYPGVVVSLYDCVTNTVISTTTTDANGDYMFAGLPNGSYYVGFGFVSGFQFTAANADLGGILGGNNSDANPSNGLTSCVNLTGNTNITTVDAGVYPGNARSATSSLGDGVWIDLNGNGLQDPGETGVAGVKVILYESDGTTVIDSTITDGMGNYIFTNLSEGAYVIGFVNSTLPVGYTFTTQGSTLENNDNSDANVTTGKTNIITLGLGEDKMSIDAGIIPPTGTLCLGDYVWFDLDNDGFQDVNEPSSPGVTVKLYNGSTNTVLQTTVTDKNGKYLFCGLSSGLSYSLSFENLPAGYSVTTQVGVLTDANNSDPNAMTARTTTFTMGTTNDMNVDAGIYSPSTGIVGNYVWYDEDEDGMQDPSESPIPGVLVTLYDQTNTPVASTVTGPNGEYLFVNVTPGTYTLGFSEYPTGLVPTTQGTNPSADDDSNVDPQTGKTSSFTLGAGEVNTTIDAGFKSKPIAGFGNYVWNDLDKDGIQDANEPGLSGVIVTLFAEDGVTPIGAAITDGNGMYSFPNVVAGNYVVGFSNIPTGFTRTVKVGTLNDPTNSDIDGTNKTGILTLTSGSYNANVDAGFYNGFPLPARELVATLATLQSNSICKVNWYTVDEENTRNFTIERSVDGVVFNTVGSTPANTSTQGQTSYTFNDQIDVLNDIEILYYRIRLFDIDDKSTVSNTLSVRLTDNLSDLIQVYPNPFLNSLQVSYSVVEASDVKIDLLDVSGRIVMSKSYSLESGMTILNLDGLETLSSGTYYARFKNFTTGEQSVRKLIK